MGKISRTTQLKTNISDTIVKFTFKRYQQGNWSECPSETYMVDLLNTREERTCRSVVPAC